MSKIKIAFVGAGYMTSEHMKAFADIAEVEMAGIFSRTKSKAEALAALYPGVQVCDSLEELYTRTKADIVVVSVPIPVVAETASKCFNYPWICLFEKPLGLNLTEANAIADEANRTNARVFVLLNRRQYASTKAVLSDLEKQQGTRLIQVNDQEDIKVQRANGSDPLLYDHWMYANAIHVIDYFCFLGRGAITGVENIVKWNPSDPGYVIAKIEYSSGDIGLYQAIWNAPAPWSVAVNTPARRWELKPLEQAAYQDYGSRKPNSVEAVQWDTQFKPGLREQAQQALNAFKKIPHTLPTLIDSLTTMQLVHAIYGV
jgi:predicted dehydrogenase